MDGCWISSAGSFSRIASLPFPGSKQQLKSIESSLKQKRVPPPTPFIAPSSAGPSKSTFIPFNIPSGIDPLSQSTPAALWTAQMLPPQNWPQHPYLQFGSPEVVIPSSQPELSLSFVTAAPRDPHGPFRSLDFGDHPLDHAF